MRTTGDCRYEDLRLVKPGIFPTWQGEENRLELGHRVRGRALESQTCVTAAAAGGNSMDGAGWRELCWSLLHGWG